MNLNRIKKFFRAPLPFKLMLAEAFFLSAFYRFCILCVPFSSLSKRIGLSGSESDPSGAWDSKIAAIGTAVNAVCNHTPWQSMCMVRALTAKKMLNRRGYVCTLYMGVAQDPQGKLIAHAWLRCGEGYVTGGNGAKIYTVTAKYT